jgi:ATP-dependent RNA helicase DHX8/PRP22
MDDLYNLEFLSLVNKITKEIENYTGHSEKLLAEFVISIHDQSNKSLSDFKKTLKESGADFPDSFVENVDRLILSMHPKYKKSNSGTNGKAKAVDSTLPEEEKKRRLFPGLALKNAEEPIPTSDDAFLQELGDIVTGRKTRPGPNEDGRAPKRQRLDRSRSPRRRSPSPDRGRERRDIRRGGGGRASLDERPVLYKIYDGRVSSVKDFGAFVSLEGVTGRAEGVCPMPNANYGCT